jgi:hypothetical protein
MCDTSVNVAHSMYTLSDNSLCIHISIPLLFVALRMGYAAHTEHCPQRTILRPNKVSDENSLPESAIYASPIMDTFALLSPDYFLPQDFNIFSMISG